MFNRKEIEELILGMADIVSENRMLRQENKYLQNKNKEYENMINDNLNRSNEMVAKILCSGLNNIVKIQNKQNGDY